MRTERKDQVVCIGAAVILAVFFLLSVLGPKAEYSYSERRMLAKLPILSSSAVLSGRWMRAFEDYTVDQFPFREPLRRVKAWTAIHLFGRREYNGLYVWDGSCAAVEYPLAEEKLDWAVERFQLIRERYLNDQNRVFLSVVPDKNCFLAAESGHLALDYPALEQMMAKKAVFAQYISISDLLAKEDYYKTDPHWRQECITDVAERLASRMGASFEDEYQVHVLTENFYGAYYGQAALPMEPDSLQYVTGPAIEECRVYDWQEQKEGEVYDRKLGTGRDPYEFFLSGSRPLLTITKGQAGQTETAVTGEAAMPGAAERSAGQKGAAQGKRLVLFRDSFGSSIAPLLLGGYDQITLVDIRYIHPEVLGRFVDFTDCDVLFLYSTLVLNHSETLK